MPAQRGLLFVVAALKGCGSEADEPFERWLVVDLCRETLWLYFGLHGWHGFVNRDLASS